MSRIKEIIDTKELIDLEQEESEVLPASQTIVPSDTMINKIIEELKNKVPYYRIKRFVRNKNGKGLTLNQIKQIHRQMKKRIQELKTTEEIN